MADIVGLILGMTFIAILVSILLFLLSIFLIIFWLAMLISAASKKDWLWFTLMIITLITGIGPLIVAGIYYFTSYKKPKKSKKAKVSKTVKSKRKKKSSNKLYLLIIILSLFLIGLAIVLLVQLNLVDNPLKEINYEPQFYSVRDECTMILGNLIHKIKNEAGCEMACKTNCGVREMNYHTSEFRESDVDCHICNCYCI